jgi:Calcineurin-like phosphoesterase
MKIIGLPSLNVTAPEMIWVIKMNNIKEIQVTTFPLVIITDTHCHIKKIDQIREKHPNCQIICLGDITDLFQKGDKGDFNGHSIDYFIKNGIPCLIGNHEEHIISCEKILDGDSLVQIRILFNEAVSLFDEYKLTNEQKDYLKNLPVGFKLILPDSSNYLCFHNRPNNLWTMTEAVDMTDEQFNEIYPMDEKTVGVIQGHNHKEFKVQYESGKIRYSLGPVKYGLYGLLTEQGIEFKRL